MNEIQSGNEPPAFTCHFIGWDGSRNGRGAGGGFVHPYEAKLAATERLNSALGAVAEELAEHVRRGCQVG